jgi:hypothetical protein
MLVFVCQAVVAFGLLSEFGCLSGGIGHAAFVCVSDSAAPWYERSLVVAALVAPLGAVLGHRRRSWRIVWTFITLSCAISVATLLWGLRNVSTGRGSSSTLRLNAAEPATSASPTLQRSGAATPPATQFMSLLGT